MNLVIDEKLKNLKPKLISPSYQMFSAVTIPIIRIGGEDHIIFELRSSRLRHQPGEVSLPGGKVETGEDSRTTAIREFCEELETDESKITIVNRLFNYSTPIRGFIHCFLARVSDDIDLSISNDEVERLFTVPVSFFKNNEPKIFNNSINIEADKALEESGILDRLKPNKEDLYSWPKLYYDILFYLYGDYTIWGITADIVKNFIELV